MCVHAKSLQSYLTLSNPVDNGPPGSSVHGILQARILERVPMPSSRESSQPRDQTLVSDVSCASRQILYHQHHLKSPSMYIHYSEKGPEVLEQANCSQLLFFLLLISPFWLILHPTSIMSFLCINPIMACYTNVMLSYHFKIKRKLISKAFHDLVC